MYGSAERPLQHRSGSLAFALFELRLARTTHQTRRTRADLPGRIADKEQDGKPADANRLALIGLEVGMSSRPTHPRSLTPTASPYWPLQRVAH